MERITFRDRKIKKPRPAKCPFVYKYGRVENADQLRWLEEIVLKNLVYFPNPSELNDPMEAKPRFRKAPPERFKEMIFRGLEPNLTLEEKRRRMEVISRKIDALGLESWSRRAEEILAQQLETQRIYSLSRRGNNRRLWEKYAENHQGYCLEFRRTGIFSAVMRVRYRKRFEFDATAKKASAAFFYYKRPKWRCEEELRIVGKRSPVGHVQFNPLVLIRIFIGKNMKHENEAVIRNWAATRKPALVVEKQPAVLI